MHASVRAELRGLPKDLAEIVAAHLVVAGQLVDSDPELAYAHAEAARRRAARLPIVREAAAETAYAAGRYDVALSEFRALRRMTGTQDYLPVMADCERALGRPEKALEYDTPKVREALDQAGRVELSIVMAGARRDLGQVAAALHLLESESLHSPAREDWVARLRYAYADTLLAADRRDDAIEWFHRTIAVDGNDVTDAEDRLSELT